MVNPHPGFEALLPYLTHLNDRAAELKAKVIELRVETLERIILDLMELEDVRK